jgi:hypothetical protein
MKNKLGILAFTVSLGSLTLQAKAESFGAIAYSIPEGNWGYFYNASSQAEADSQAVTYCQQNGGTQCASVTQFSGSYCGSLTRGNKNRWAITYGENAGNATRNALNRCVEVSGTNCKKLATVCAADGLITDNVGPSPYDRGLLDDIIAYAADRLGQTIGNGECWTLVDAAMADAGAKRPGTGGLGTYEFGGQVYAIYVPGDIMQFENVVFTYSNGRTENYPHHTAIIESVSGTSITILNQNVNGVRSVVRSTLDLNAQNSGTIRVYRPAR